MLQLLWRMNSVSEERRVMARRGLALSLAMAYLVAIRSRVALRDSCECLAQG